MTNAERYADSIAQRQRAVEALLTSPPPDGWSARAMRMAAWAYRKAGNYRQASIHKQAAQYIEKMAP